MVNSVSDNGHLCFITGSFQDNLSIGNQTIESQGADDVFVVCLDENENIKWFKHFGGPRKDRVSTIKADKDEVLITGSFCSKLNIDDKSITSKKESSDIFIVSLDTTGKLNWIKQLGGEFDDYPKSMTTTKDGYIYIAGSYRQTMTVLEKSIQSKGEEDVFVGRLENCKFLAPKFKTPEKFCEGTKLKLDAGDGFLSYDWNHGLSLERSITVDQGGVYTLDLVAKNGCMIFDTVNVVENPTPDVFIGNDTTIMDTAQLVLKTERKYKEYLWSNGSKDSQIVVHGFNCNEGLNRFEVKVANENGCFGKDEIYVTVIKTKPNTISESLANSVILYPNPTYDNVTVVFSRGYDKLDLKLYDSYGKEITTKRISNYLANTPIDFDLGSYLPGLYTLTAQIQDGFVAKKIILQ
jgi:hypothetical protein